MFKRLFFPLVLWCTFFLSAHAINFSRVNLAWQYDPTFDLKIAHRVISQEESTSIIIRLRGDSINSYSYEFLWQEDYESESHEIIANPSLDTLFLSEREIYLRLEITPTSQRVAVLKFFALEAFYYYDMSLTIGSLSFPSIYVEDSRGLPIVDSYVNTSKFTWRGSDQFLTMGYEENFAIPNPPMADMKTLAPDADLDTTFVFSDTVQFADGHFYTTRADSLSNTGITLLKTPPYFPKYRQLSELLTSMLYITSERERKELLSDSNPKRAFDSFWMNTFSTKSRARNAIRNYYDNVETTNRLFTDFTPGWKTDRGMVYMVFGKPDEVYRTENKEEWYYDNGLYFEFRIFSSFFAPKTYALRRNKNLEEAWYNQVSYIRQGIR